MAKLSAHGNEIGRIEYVSKTVAYFQDGKILKNDGFGWKTYGTVKIGFTAQDAFNRSKENQTRFYAENLCFKRYRDLMTDIPLSIRWKVLSAFEMMGDDIDGVWSTLDDSYETRSRFSLEDLQEIEVARAAAALEKKDRVAAAVPVPVEA